MNVFTLPIFLALAAVIVIGVASGPAKKAEEARKEEHIRRIAVEEACRTIVEAGLVASCTIKNK